MGEVASLESVEVQGGHRQSEAVICAEEGGDSKLGDGIS